MYSKLRLFELKKCQVKDKTFFIELSKVFRGGEV